VTKRERNKLSRERVLEATAQLVRSEGLDALSMRRLAQRLDVWPMSIYTYFRDKDELLDALWREQMRDLLHDIRRLLGNEPRGTKRALSSAEFARLSGAGQEILSRAGLEDAEAASAWRALLSYTVGFAMTAQPEGGEDEDEEFARGLDRLAGPSSGSPSRALPRPE
jgi:AcrR family transcriptional regulator